jgi:hypothetical protein
MSSGEKVSSDMNIFPGDFSVSRHQDFEIFSNFYRFFGLRHVSLRDLQLQSVGLRDSQAENLIPSLFLYWWKRKRRRDEWSQTGGIVFSRLCKVFATSEEHEQGNIVFRVCASWSTQGGIDFRVCASWSEDIQAMSVYEELRVSEERYTMTVYEETVYEEAVYEGLLTTLRHPSSSTAETVLGRTAKQHQPVQCDCPKFLLEFLFGVLRTRAEDFPWVACLTNFTARRIFSSERAFSCDLSLPPLSEDTARRKTTDDEYSKLRTPHQANYASGRELKILLSGRRMSVYEISPEVGDMTSSFSQKASVYENQEMSVYERCRFTRDAGLRDVSLRSECDSDCIKCPQSRIRSVCVVL